MSDRLAGYKRIEQVTALGLEVVDVKRSGTEEIPYIRITLKDDPDVLSSCGIGLIFALAILSFRDARPAGYSGRDFVEEDEFTVADLVEHLRFERGRLYFYVDYLRGRLVKTSVEIDREGTIVLETKNRGEAAARWVAKLQGKQVIGLVN